MADKMMRVAGRNDEGLSKPLALDSFGNLKVQLSNDGELPIYAEGVEYSEIVSGHTVGKGTYQSKTKENDHLKMMVQGSGGRGSYETKKAVSLNNIKDIKVEFQFSSETERSSPTNPQRFMLYITKVAGADYTTTYSTRKLVDFSKPGDYQQVIMDVSGFSGMYYIGVAPTSLTIGNTTVVKVKSIIMEDINTFRKDSASNLIDKMLNDNVAFNMLGESPETGAPAKVSTVKDPTTGLHYLATTNVGQVAYDEFYDTYKVDTRIASELMFEHSVDLTSSSAYGVGSNVSIYSTTKVSPLNMAKKNEIFILVNNLHDKSVEFRVFFYKDETAYTYLEMSENAIDVLQASPSTLEFTIPANSKLRLNAGEYPQLASPYPYFAMHIHRLMTPTTGDIKIIGFGK